MAAQSITLQLDSIPFLLQTSCGARLLLSTIFAHQYLHPVFSNACFHADSLLEGNTSWLISETPVSSTEPRTE